jgi:hypothetical protein
MALSFPGSFVSTCTATEAAFPLSGDADAGRNRTVPVTGAVTVQHEAR